MRQFIYKHISLKENQKEFLLPDLGMKQGEDKSLKVELLSKKEKKRNSFLFKESENALSQKGQNAMDIPLR